MKLLISICARGGSKGIPGKNIRSIKGKPLVAYTIETAIKFAGSHNAIISISTDDEKIKLVAAEYGLITHYDRPAILATDIAGKISVIEDLLMYEEKFHATNFDFVLDLDVTSPLRTQDDLQLALQMINNDPAALNLFSVNNASRNPYFNMVEQNREGYFQLVKQGNFDTRQSAPPVYELNASFYFYRRTFFEQQDKSTISKRSLVYVMPHICFDLDHPVDFEFMDFLMSNNKLDFSL